MVRWKTNKVGDRRIKTVFALFPIRIMDEVVWLQFVKIGQEYTYWKYGYYWSNECFIYDKKDTGKFINMCNTKKLTGQIQDEIIRRMSENGTSNEFADETTIEQKIVDGMKDIVENAIKLVTICDEINRKRSSL